MFRLDNISPVTKKRKRVGRGGSRGGTSGKGHKGQKARSGGTVRTGFEGGQMPLFRRLPKRGFTNARFKKVVETINIGALERVFDNETEITRDVLIARKLIKPKKNVSFAVKVLGDGALSKKFTLVVDQISKSARNAIESAGGQVTLLSKD